MSNKHEATYHGVPSEVRMNDDLTRIKHTYADAMRAKTGVGTATFDAEFDRFIAKIRAEALTDLADQMRDRFTASWIRGKARELTHGPRKITGAFAVPESEADCGDNDL